MGHHQQGGRHALQILFQPLHGRCVYVVGWFVEDEEVAGVEQRLGEGDAPLLATAQCAHGRFKLGDAQLGEGVFGVGLGRPAPHAVHLGRKLPQLPLQLEVGGLVVQGKADPLVVAQEGHLGGVGLEDGLQNG